MRAFASLRCATSNERIMQRSAFAGTRFAIKTHRHHRCLVYLHHIAGLDTVMTREALIDQALLKWLEHKPAEKRTRIERHCGDDRQVALHRQDRIECNIHKMRNLA